MEFIDSQHGVGVLLVSIALLLCFQLIARVGEFLWKLSAKKAEVSDKTVSEISLALSSNTNAVRELRIQMGILERELGEIQKFKTDRNRLFAAVKALAGPKWAEIRKAMAEDDIPS